MALSTKNVKAERLARELARRTGESLTDAVTLALEQRLKRVAPAKRGERKLTRLNEIALRIARLPELERRAADAIVGCDENGLPR